MNWLLLNILSAVGVSVSRILQRIVLKDDEVDTFAFSFIFPILVGAVILLYAIVTGSLEFPNLLPLTFNLILMTVFYSAGTLCLYKAYKESPASEISIIFASSSIWSAISSVLILGEVLTAKNVLGISAIIAGVIAINYQKTNWKLSSGHIYALIGAVFFGVAFTNDIVILKSFASMPSYLFIAFMSPAAGILLYQPKLVNKLSYFLSKQVLTKLLLTAVIYAFSAIAIYAAYQLGGKASIIIPIQQTNIILTVILSYLFLGEKDKLLNKIAGMSLAFIGVLLLI